MKYRLDGKKVAILVADGFEQVELSEPKTALEKAGAETEIVSPAGEKVRGWEETEWGKSFRDGIGGQYKFTASLRGDAYWVNNLSPISNPDLPSSFFPANGMPAISPISTNFLATRALPWSLDADRCGRR